MKNLGLGLGLGGGRSAAAPPVVPPGSPVLWVRADLGLSTGNVTSWDDQSGNGNNLALVGGGTAPVNTAGAGPGGTLPAVVFSSAHWEALQIANALIGTENFTIAVVGKFTATSTQQLFVQSGNINTGQNIGISNFNDGNRHCDQSLAHNITDGAATTAWEAWVFTSDALGNLTLLVNGVPQALSPSSSVAVPPVATFTVGSTAQATALLNGSIFEVLVWTTAQDNATVYAYQHAITGL